MYYHNTKESNCPICLAMFNAATGLLSTKPPQENDISICAYCGVILIFDKKLDLIVCPDHILINIQTNDPILYDEIIEVCFSIITRSL